MATKSDYKDGAAAEPSKFYGLADHPKENMWVFKKNRIRMDEECEKMCKKLEEYKKACDELHQAMAYFVVENKEHCKQLPDNFEYEKAYSYTGHYLEIYQIMVNIKNRNAKKLEWENEYESLDTASRALKQMQMVYTGYLKKQIKTLEPLAMFIGKNYWDYAVLRRRYWEAIVKHDEVMMAMSKNRSEHIPFLDKDRIKELEEAKRRMSDCMGTLFNYSNTEIFGRKESHKQAIIKFYANIVEYHKTLAELLDLEKNKKETKVVKKK